MSEQHTFDNFANRRKQTDGSVASGGAKGFVLFGKITVESFQSERMYLKCMVTFMKCFKLPRDVS